jgi:outer membrane protein TolC
MELLKAVSPAGAKTYMDHRAAIMDDPRFQALPLKIKLLVGIGVAAALQSSTCTLMWTKLGKKEDAAFVVIEGRRQRKRTKLGRDEMLRCRKNVRLMPAGPFRSIRSLGSGGVVVAQKLRLMVALVTGAAFLLPSLPVPALETREGLALKECLTTALARNPAVIEAGLGIKSSEESVISSQGRYWPRLSVDGAYTRREKPFPYIQAQAADIPPHFSDEWNSIGVAMAISIYQGGQVSTAVSLAQVRREIQVLAASQTRNDIIANTVNAYNKILQLQELRKASQAQVEALEEQVNNTRLLLDLGRAARVDVLKVEVQLANERQRLLAIDEGLKTASAILQYLMGKGPEAENPLPALTDRLAMGGFTADFESGRALAYERRPEYLSAKKFVEEARLNRRLAFGRLLPTVNVFASEVSLTGYRPGYNDTIWTAGVTFSIPLFDRSLYADLSRERIQMERASQRLVAADNQMRLELSTAVASLIESGNRVGAAEKAVAQGEESFRIERQRYSSGAGSMVDLLFAQSASINAVANFTQALFDYNAALVAYRKATGTLEDYLK